MIVDGALRGANFNPWYESSYISIFYIGIFTFVEAVLEGEIVLFLDLYKRLVVRVFIFHGYYAPE